MDAKRICHVILLTLIPFWTAPGQDKGAESAKSEALTLKAQMVEFENLKAEIKAQEEKIDRLTQEVAKLAEAAEFSGLAGEFRCHSLHRSQISKDL
jgi:cell division protein FtsB